MLTCQLAWTEGWTCAYIHLTAPSRARTLRAQSEKKSYVDDGDSDDEDDVPLKSVAKKAKKDTAKSKKVACSFPLSERPPLLRVGCCHMCVRMCD